MHRNKLNFPKSSPAVENRIAEIAEHFVHRFDDALSADGVLALTGIEDEFILNRDLKVPVNGDRTKKEFADDVDDAFTLGANEESRRLNRQEAEWKHYRYVPDNEPVNLASPSSRTRRNGVSFKREMGDEQYETHCDPAPPLVTLKRLHKIRAFIERVASEDRSLSSSEQRWGVTAINRHSVAPDHNQVAQALHTNLSLWEKTPEGKFENRLSDEDYFNILNRSIQNLSINNALPIIKFNTFQRWKAVVNENRNAYDDSVSTLNYDSEDYKGTHRLEYKLPDADCIPECAMLMVMAAAYMTHRLTSKSKTQGDLIDIEKNMRITQAALPENMEEAIRRFSDDKQCNNSLYRLMVDVAEQSGHPEDIAMADELYRLIIQKSRQIAEPYSGQNIR